MFERSPASPAAAFAVATLGIAVFSCMDAVMKGLSLAMGAYNTLLWRSLAGVAMSGTLYTFAKAPWPSRHVMRLHLARGLVSSAMSVLFFWGLARVPMAQAITLTYVAPVIALFLSALILKEAIGRATIVASIIAVVGVLTIFAGQARANLGQEALYGTLAVLASALCYAVNIVLMRAQALVAKPIELTFWQSLIVLACLACAAPWLAFVPDARHAPMLLLAAGLATVSLLMLGWAYAHGPASYLAPTEYSSFVWAAGLGWLVFAEPLSLWTVAGAAMIVGASVIAARRTPPPVSNIEAAP